MYGAPRQRPTESCPPTHAHSRLGSSSMRTSHISWLPGGREDRTAIMVYFPSFDNSTYGVGYMGETQGSAGTERRGRSDNITLWFNFWWAIRAI
jgi:hypothetical protein